MHILVTSFMFITASLLAHFLKRDSSDTCAGVKRVMMPGSISMHHTWPASWQMLNDMLFAMRNTAPPRAPEQVQVSDMSEALNLYNSDAVKDLYPWLAFHSISYFAIPNQRTNH